MNYRLNHFVLFNINLINILRTFYNTIKKVVKCAYSTVCKLISITKVFLLLTSYSVLKDITINYNNFTSLLFLKEFP